ncbi:hypothetical protein BLNAU_15011 [Blattamonas nauphoetae]|uniref:Transmembrane protein n=1 Tax=Blattamonas nauphoetae TaxID=2049346 RepID=A0ABQ9XEH0_9EUKA|nr:hypothetical protein BLNAU_15011 [Blattamonas nauphoetae]
MIDLQDLIAEHPQQTFSVGLSDVYRASEVLLKSRTVTLVGVTSSALLDLEMEQRWAFDVNDCVLKVNTLTIKPSRFSSFAKAENESEMWLDQCVYCTLDFCQSIVVGERSTLTLSSISMRFVTFRASLISTIGGIDNPHLSISLSSCMFANATLVSPTPIIGGTDVETITVSNCSFLNIAILEESHQPLAPISGVPSRRVEIVGTILDEVDGPLCGTIVFGLQADVLKLELVTMTNCSNAVRFWENAVFAERSEVWVNLCSIEESRTTPFQPNGSFLFLCNPHTTITLNSSSFAHCTASEDGGCVWTSSQAQIEIENSTATNCSAGGRGGWICSTGAHTTFAGRNSSSMCCSAGGQGGSLFVAGLASFWAIWVTLANCSSGESGGGMALVVENDAVLSFSRVDFRTNTASSMVGNDVVVTSLPSAGTPLRKKDLKTCWSTSATPKVSLLPTNTHINWVNPLRPDWVFPDWLFGVFLLSSFSFVAVGGFICTGIVAVCEKRCKRKKREAEIRNELLEDERQRRMREEMSRALIEGLERESEADPHRREEQAGECEMKREVDGVAETENQPSSLKDDCEQASPSPSAHPRSSSYCPPQPLPVPTLLIWKDEQNHAQPSNQSVRDESGCASEETDEHQSVPPTLHQPSPLQ